jgi:CemA family
MNRLFGGLSDTAKAFVIIASTDILLGYHSEEGWTAGIRLITQHYGVEAEVGC